MSVRDRIWNWLPTFDAVVREGSIGAASRSMHVTPAAVSRTIRLLESELGSTLFNRVGRTLVLNERGARLREGVADAIDRIEVSIVRSLSSPFEGPLRVASLGVLTDHFVVTALLGLKSEHPGLLPEHRNLPPAAALREIARGALDVAFFYEELGHDGVDVTHVSTTTASVYCGVGHPLFGHDASADELAEHPFSVPQVGDSGRVLDGWPPTVARQIGMRITTLRSNLEVCESGTLLCVLPDITADESFRAGRLHRLTAVSLEPIPIFAARGEGVIPGGAAELLVERVGAMVDSFTLFSA